mgnify:CR=1 FL=1
MRSLLLAGVALTVWAPAPSALAQEPGAEVTDTITITARKREETLADAPITVTAFTEAAIEARGLTDIEDVSRFSPGFFFTPQGSQRGGRSESVIRFRGMDINDVSPTQQLASVFIDGVYVSGGVASIGFEDVERIEVIKGPQSAYFGRSTFGGAVNFITRDPGDEFGLRSRLEIAEGETIDLRAAVEGPILGDVVSARLSGRWYTTGGRYESSVDGGELGKEETRSASLTLTADLSESFSARGRVFYAEDEDGLPTTFALGEPYRNCGPFFTGGVSYFCGDLPVIDGVPLNTRLTPLQRDVFIENSRDSFGIGFGPDLDGPGLARERLRASLEFTYEFADLGWTLSSTHSINTEEQSRLIDFDFTGDDVWREASFQDIEDWGHEIRLTGRNFNVDWLLGVSSFYLNFRRPEGSIALLNPNAVFTNGFFLDQRTGEDEVRTDAVFGALGWQVTDTLSLDFEARFQSDEIDQGEIGGVELNETFENFLPRVIAQWKPNNSTNLYFIYSQGNKPGDFNDAVVSLTPTQKEQVFEQTGGREFLDEEELTNYEIGVKQAFGPAYIAAAAYYMEWTNQQTRTQAVVDDPSVPSGVRAVPVLISAGATDLWGVELEGHVDLTDRLRLEGTFNWAASEYQEFDCGFCERVLGTSDMSGKQSPRFPEFSGSASAAYEDVLDNGLGWFARADALYTGEAYIEAINLATVNSFWRLNLRAGLEGENWRLTGYVENALDDDSYESGARFTDFTKGNFDLSDFVANVTPAQPRTFGAVLSVAY